MDNRTPLGVFENANLSAYAFDSAGFVGLAIKKNKHESEVITTNIASDGFQGFQMEDSILVVVSRDAIFYSYRDAKWQSIRNGIAGTISALLLKESALYLGYDNGEWGGVAAKIEFHSDSIFTDTLFEGNIRAIAADSSGKIWFAGGLSHLSVA